MQKIPEDGILENFFKMRLGGSEQLESTLALKTLATMHKGEEPSYIRLKDLVRRF